MAEYDRLSALDEGFLHLERPDTPMHVGAIAILERDPFYDASGRFRIEAVRAHVAERLELIPRFRKRLLPVRLRSFRSIWTDDERFDVRRHVQLTQLPAPGSRRALLELGERLTAQLLDRDHPLWEIWLVDGVDDGRHVGLIHKSHHALTDGISGVDLALALLDFTRDPPTRPAAAAWQPEAAPLDSRLLIDSVRELAGRGMEQAAVARRIADSPRLAFARMRRVGRSVGSLLRPDLVVARSSFNGPLAAGRRLETLRLPLDAARKISQVFDCTVNDVVLTVVAGAVARLLDARGELHPDLVLKVLCPVSVRDDSERMHLGNKFSAMLVPLPVGIVDSCARLDAIASATAELKDREQALGLASVLGLSYQVVPTMLGVAARALQEQRFVHLIVTNMPGPDVPLYGLGARMLEVYPIVPLQKNLTLNVAMLSYCGELHFGLVGDGGSRRDLELLAGGIEDSFADLVSIA